MQQFFFFDKKIKVNNIQQLQFDSYIYKTSIVTCILTKVCSFNENI